MEDNFSAHRKWGDGLGMIEAYYIHDALYFYYYYTSSTSDHQALDPGGWGALFFRVKPGKDPGRLELRAVLPCVSEPAP